MWTSRPPGAPPVVGPEREVLVRIDVDPLWLTEANRWLAVAQGGH
jgi:hypothetical protein